MRAIVIAPVALRGRLMRTGMLAMMLKLGMSAEHGWSRSLHIRVEESIGVSLTL